LENFPKLTSRTVLRLTYFASLSKTELYAGNSSHSLCYSFVTETSSKNAKDKGTIRREGSEAIQKTLRDFTFRICFEKQIKIKSDLHGDMQRVGEITTPFQSDFRKVTM
jgi:hypothetical protein